MSWLHGSSDRRDVLLALSVTGLAQVEVWSGFVTGGPKAPIAATALVTGLALAWRRRAPITVVVLVCASRIAQALMGVDSTTFFVPVIALVVAVWSAGYHSRRPVVALLTALGLVWASVMIEYGDPWPGELLFSGFAVGGMWLAGHAVGVRQIRTQLLQQRTVRLEQDAEWQSRLPWRRNGLGSRVTCTTLSRTT